MKQLILLVFTLFAFSSIAMAEQDNRVECPKVEELSEISLELDEQELRKALSEKIVQSLYGRSALYKKWDVEMVKPLQDLKHADPSYYNMAIHHCGKKVADHTWFVRLRFSGSQMNMLGEFFVSKDKQQKWKVWFRYI